MREDVFERYVKDALVNLYDPIHLQTHPLVELLHLSPTTGQTAGETLRQYLRDTIEKLRPPATVPLDRPEWLNYRLLWVRYVQSFSQSDTCQELGLSQATFYRRHQEALSAVTSLLWEKYHREQTAAEEASKEKPGSDRSAAQTPRERAREHAIRLATTSPREAVDLKALLDGVCQVMTPVLQAQGLTLLVQTPPSLPTTCADPALLRQILLGVLTEGVRRAKGRTLRLHARAKRGALVWHLEPLQAPAPTTAANANSETDLGMTICEALLEAYDGRLWSETIQDSYALCGLLPICQTKTILIVDDDADAIQLYRRYLEAEGFAIRVARHGDELERLLTGDLPDLIILDVLMPKWDGWAILQRLRTLPETSAIPVVICSVLSQAGLALGLGANCVLHKPITQQQLLQAVQNLLQRRRNEDAARPAKPADI